jgi:hypothetical protein
MKKLSFAGRNRLALASAVAMAAGALLVFPAATAEAHVVANVTHDCKTVTAHHTNFSSGVSHMVLTVHVTGQSDVVVKEDHNGPNFDVTADIPGPSASTSFSIDESWTGADTGAFGPMTYTRDASCSTTAPTESLTVAKDGACDANFVYYSVTNSGTTTAKYEVTAQQDAGAPGVLVDSNVAGGSSVHNKVPYSPGTKTVTVTVSDTTNTPAVPATGSPLVYDVTTCGSQPSGTPTPKPSHTPSPKPSHSTPGPVVSTPTHVVTQPANHTATPSSPAPVFNNGSPSFRPQPQGPVPAGNASTHSMSTGAMFGLLLLCAGSAGLGVAFLRRRGAPRHG